MADVVGGLKLYDVEVNLPFPYMHLNEMHKEWLTIPTSCFV